MYTRNLDIYSKDSLVVKDNTKSTLLFGKKCATYLKYRKAPD